MCIGTYVAEHGNFNHVYLTKLEEQYDACKRYHTAMINGCKHAAHEWGKELAAKDRQELRARLESMYAEQEHQSFLKIVQRLVEIPSSSIADPPLFRSDEGGGRRSDSAFLNFRFSGWGGVKVQIGSVSRPGDNARM